MAAKKKVKLSKDSVSIDLSGVQASDRRRKARIPEGIYRAKVVNVEAKKFKSDSKGVVWTFEVTDEGKGKGARFWYNNVLQNADGSTAESSLWSFKGVLQALSPKVKLKDGLMNIPLEKLKNRTCALDIADDEYEGKMKSEIVDVFHESLIEEDDDEDEVEEEDDDFEEEEEDDEEEDDEDEDEEEEDDDEFDLDEDEL